MVLQLWKSVDACAYASLEDKVTDYVRQGEAEVTSCTLDEKARYKEQFAGMAVYDYFSGPLLLDHSLHSFKHVFVVGPTYSGDGEYKIYVADTEDKGFLELQEKYGNVIAFMQDVRISPRKVGIFSPR